nr:hypothetical protein [Mycobacterium haemophilum]
MSARAATYLVEYAQKYRRTITAVVREEFAAKTVS